jgi:hypothetical protein
MRENRGSRGQAGDETMSEPDLILLISRLQAEVTVLTKDVH